MSNGVNLWIERVVNPVRDKAAGFSVGPALRAFLNTKNPGLEEQHELQCNALRRLLYQCFEYVEGYRPYRSARNIAKNDPFAALATIPPLDAKLYRKNPDVYRRQDQSQRDVAHGRPHLTAGYTYDLSKAAWSANQAALAWVYSLWGLQYWGLHVRLQGHLSEDAFGEFMHKAHMRLSRNRLSPTGTALHPKDIPDLLKMLQREDLSHLVGTPSLMAALAEMIVSGGHTIKPGFKGIVATGEALLDDEKSLLAKTFGVPVYSTYTSRDDGLIAWDCGGGGLHIVEQNFIVEVIDHAGQALPEGTDGRVAVTNLHNTYMPRLRFLTGDTASLTSAPCACGRQGKRLVSLQGRKRPVFTTPDGRKVPGRVIDLLAAQQSGVNTYQLIQQDTTHATLTVEIRTGVAQEQAVALHRKIEALLPGVLVLFSCRVANQQITV